MTDDLKALVARLRNAAEWDRAVGVNPQRAADLYAAADLIDSMAQRVPLSDEEIDKLWQDWLTVKYGAVTKNEGRIFARLVEAAHGIRSEK